MRHLKKGKKLNRSLAERKSLYRNLITSVIMHERIKTTEVKGKAVKPLLERLITTAKKQTLPARRRIEQIIPTAEAQNKLYTELSQRFAERVGGYARIIHIGKRLTDQTSMVYLELLDQPDQAPKVKKTKEKK